MAIAKTIPIHINSYIQTAYDYVRNEEKTRMSNSDKALSDEELKEIEKQKEQFLKDSNLSSLVKANDDDRDLLVTGYHCSPATAMQEFLLTEQKYRRIHGDYQPVTARNKYGKEIVKQEIIAYHIIQSFPKYQKIEPHEVNQMGYELAQRLGEYQAIICTHMDKDHLHNHILTCNYSMDGTHKIPLTMDFREHIRDLNDEISVSHGFEIPPQLLERDRYAKTKTWLEWKEMQIQDGTERLWKTNLRNTISFMSRQAVSFEDYLQKMKNAGYGIRNNEHCITYTLPDGSHSCKDSLLGKQYEKTTLIKSLQEKEQSLQTLSDQNRTFPFALETHPKKARKERLDVSRYDDYGRRRSDLEMSVLFAIQIIQKIMDKYQDKDNLYNTDPVFMDADRKLSHLQKTLMTIREKGYTSKEELIRKNEILKQEYGKACLAETKAKDAVYKYDSLTKLLEETTELSVIADSLNLTETDIFLDSFSKEEIRKNLAELLPPTGQQKRNLYLAMEQNPDLKIMYKIQDLSANDIDSVLSYLSDRIRVQRPEILVSASEYDEVVKKKSLHIDKAAIYALERYRLDSIKKKREKKEEPNPYFKKKVLEFAVQKGITQEMLHGSGDNSTLTKNDLMELNNYLTYHDEKKSPAVMLASPVAPPVTCSYIEMELQKKDYTIFRKNGLLTEKEADTVMKWITSEYPEKNRPSMIKTKDELEQSEFASEKLAKQIRELAAIRSVELTMEPEVMGMQECYQIRNYLLHMHDIPDCLSHIPEIADTEIPLTREPVAIAAIDRKEAAMKANRESFIELMNRKGLTDSEMKQMERLRNNLNTLQSLGITASEVQALTKQISGLKESYMRTHNMKDLIKGQQREICTLLNKLKLDEKRYHDILENARMEKRKIQDDYKQSRNALSYTGLSENAKFVYGPLYDRNKDIQYVMNETETARGQEQEKEPKKSEQELMH